MDEQERGLRALDDALGPFYDSAGMQAWLGLSQEEVTDLVLNKKVLAVEAEPGDFLFPASQFGENGAFLPRLAEVLEVLRESDSDSWTHALWLVGRDPQDNANAIELLSAGRADEVLDSARNWVETWKH